MSLPPVIAIVGPTATGKTTLGVFVAKHLGSEVVSADSRVIYQGLSIGTAKPTVEERQGVVHHMIDAAQPTEAYSVARYQQEALPLLQSLWTAGKTPVVVGGTGFYLRALLQQSFVPPVPPDPVFRANMAERVEMEGLQVLYEELKAQDPGRAGALYPTDAFRIIRALEIIHHTGQPVPKIPTDRALDVTWIGLTVRDRDFLRKRIDDRVEAMLQAGWLEEVAELMEVYGPEAEALQVTHGYPELVRVLQGEWSLEEAKADIQIQIHQYARRQMTWFKRNREIQWFFIDEQPFEEILQAVVKAL